MLQESQVAKRTEQVAAQINRWLLELLECNLPDGGEDFMINTVQGGIIHAIVYDTDGNDFDVEFGLEVFKR